MFFGGLLLSAMTFVGCTDEYDDWAEPQSNPQEEAAAALPGYTATGVGAIDLGTVTADSVQVLTLSTVTLPEGATVGNTRVEMLPADGSSAAATTINVGNNGKMAVAELQAAIEEYYGKRPEQRVFNGHVYSNIIIDGQAFLVDAGQITLTVTPDAPFISEGYYLVGDMTNWFKGTPIPFTHSGADVYEDPVFTVTFTATDNCCWKIVPQSNVDRGDLEYEGEDGVVGVVEDGDDAVEGTLVTNDPQAGKIVKAGMYRMTINMLEYTYKIENLAVPYYLVGDFGGASWDMTDLSYAFYPETATKQSYTTKWDGAGSFKFFTEVNNWDSAYGAAKGTAAGATSGSIASNASNGADNITVPEVGEYYTFTFDLAEMTFTWTKIEPAPKTYATIGVIGDFNSWGDDVDMTEVAPHNWYVEVELKAGGFKFRANNDWTDQWAGEANDVSSSNYGTAEFNGGDMKVPDGKYRIYFNDITAQYIFIPAE